MYNELRHFVVLVDQGSITRAARALGLTQSALTKSLRRLEDYIGAELLERLPRGVRPTGAGERIYRRAKAVETEMRYVELEASGLKEQASKSLHIGTIPFWNVTVLPNIVSQFQELYPEVRLVINADAPRRLIGLLSAGELDFALCGTDLGITDPGLASEAIGRVDLVAGCARDHPLALSWDGDVARLLEQKWLDYRSAPGHFSDAEEDSLLYRLRRDAILITDSWLGGLLLAARSGYLMALPRQLEGFFSHFGLVLLADSPILLSSPSGLWYRKSAAETKAGRAFARLARQEMRQFG